MTFDDKAKDWDSNPMTVERANVLANEIRNFIAPNGKTDALDYGSGTGLLSYFLKDDFRSITLADTSKGMLDVLAEKIQRENLQHFTPLLLDLSVSDFPVEVTTQFDVVFSSMAFHHVPDINALMLRLHKQMTTGGYVCVADLDQEDGRFHWHEPSFDGHKGFSRETIELYLTQNGFEVKLYKIFFEVEREFPSGEKKKYPVFLIIGQKI